MRTRGVDNGTFSHAGAVYLFTFTDDAFSGGRLVATVGKGYTGGPDIGPDAPGVDTGGGNVDVTALQVGDRFGSRGIAERGGATVSRSGRWYDDGAGNGTHAGPEPVYLFTFS